MNTIYRLFNRLSNRYKSLPNEIIKQKLYKTKNKLKFISLLNAFIYKVCQIELRKEQILAFLYGETHFIQLPTGSGKSFVILCWAIYEYLQNKKVFVTSMNNYLAYRDYMNSLRILQELDIKSRFFRLDEETQGLTDNSIVFCAIQDLVFQQLKDFLYKKENRQIQKHDVIILDEIDYMLVDSFYSTFSLSSNDEYNSNFLFNRFHIAFDIAKSLSHKIIVTSDNSNNNNDLYTMYIDYDYCIEYLKNSIYLTYKGLNKLYDFCNNIGETDFLLLKTLVETFLYIKHFLIKGRDYAVIDDDIRTINKFTGELGETTEYDFILQNFLRFINGIPLKTSVSRGLSLDYPNFINLFHTTYGCSGTIGNYKYLYKTYGKKIKEFKVNQRLDKIEISKNSFKEVLDEIIGLSATENPILIVAKTDSQVDIIHKRLTEKFRNEKQYYLFNSSSDFKYIYEIFKNPLNKNTIIIANNRLSRGIDILIDDECTSLGGLYVIQIGLHYLQSINIQISGRAARNGKEGKYYLYKYPDNDFKFIKDCEYSTYLYKYNRVQETYRQSLYIQNNIIFEYKKNIISLTDRLSEVDFDKFKNYFISVFELLKNKHEISNEYVCFLDILENNKLREIFILNFKINLFYSIDLDYLVSSTNEFITLLEQLFIKAYIQTTEELLNLLKEV